MQYLLSKLRKRFTDEDVSDLQFFNQDLLRKVVYFEWILLFIAAVGELISLHYHAPDPTAPNLGVSLFFLGIVFVLSFVRPMRSTYWDRLCFLFLEIGLLTGAAAAGLARFVFPIYMVSVAKACLLLDRGGLATIFFTAIVAQFAYGGFKFWAINTWVQQEPWAWRSIISMFLFALVNNYAAFPLMFLVGLVTISLVGEQKLRLETERLSKEVESLATELERSRIAREIHDSLGHTLTSMNIQLEVARKFAERDTKTALEALDLAKQLASQSLTDVRMAVHSIRNPDFKLHDAVIDMSAQIKKVQSLDVQVNMQMPEVSSAVSYQLYRIIQECLTNVIKHAQATEATVELTHDGKELALVVSDNGKGLEDAQGLSGGFGIRGMRERVESLHGTVTIQSEPDKGTKLQVKIPI